MKTVELKISGMHCQHCEMRVKKALGAVKGVVSVEAYNEKGVAIVEAEDYVTVESLIDAVNATELYEASV